MWERLGSLDRLTINESLSVYIVRCGHKYLIDVIEKGKTSRCLGVWSNLLIARTVAEDYRDEMTGRVKLAA